MSLAKRLANRCIASEASADRIVELLERFALTALVPQLKTHIARQAVRKARYTDVHIRSVVPVSEHEAQALSALVGAAADTPRTVSIDPTLVQGTEVTYGGRKWSGDARTMLRRFVGTR